MGWGRGEGAPRGREGGGGRKKRGGGGEGRGAPGPPGGKKTPGAPPRGPGGGVGGGARPPPTAISAHPAMTFFISLSAQATASLVDVPVTALAIMLGRMKELVMSWTLSLGGDGQP